MRLIDADALIERWNNMSVRGRTEFDQEIMLAPSIDINRPQGEWIYKNKAFLKAITAVGVGLGKAKLECFKCGYEVPAVLEKENRNYCPNCGAKFIGIRGIITEK